MLILDERSNLQ